MAAEKTGRNTGKTYPGRRRRGQYSARRRRRKLLRLLSVAALLIAAVSVGILADRLEKRERTETVGSLEEPGFEVIFLDVGEADAALVTADGHSMLVDGGNRDDSALVYDVLQREGVRRLDYVAASHAHEDHAGGLVSVFGVIEKAVSEEDGKPVFERSLQAAIPAGGILVPQADSDNYFFHELVTMAAKSGVPVRVPSAGETFDLGGARVTVLGPVRSAEEILSDEYHNVNNTSLVLRIEYGEISVLFTGDAEWAEEGEIVEFFRNEEPSPLDCTILKTAHHGSTTSTSAAFLEAAAPEYAVISCGAGNGNGHPHSQTVEKLEASGAEILRTDLQGEVRFVSDGKVLSISTGGEAAEGE